MRRIIFLLLASVTLLSSCDKGDGMIWDIAPVVMFVRVVDTEGRDLLNPQTPGALNLSEIKAIYNGQEYVCNSAANEVSTKYYLPHFYGLKSDFHPFDEMYQLLFGEFEGARSYKNESIKLVWADGSSDIIRFNRTYKSGSKGEPSIKQEWFLNDKKVTDWYIKIVK